MVRVMPTERAPSLGPVAVRRVAATLAFVAATLAVAAILHLVGHVHGRANSFHPDDAGIAEAIIGAVLAGGAIAMVRVPARARRTGLALTIFAVVGFLVGLSNTAADGAAPDIAYHVFGLVVLVSCLVVLVRARHDAGTADQR